MGAKARQDKKDFMTQYGATSPSLLEERREQTGYDHISTRHIFSCFTHAHFNVERDIGSRCLARITSCHHAFGCAFDLILITLYSAFFTVSRIFLFILLFCIFIFHVGWFDEKSHAYFREWGEESRTSAENNPLRSYEPNFIDNYHISETTEISIQESSSESKPSNLHDSEFDDYTIGRARASPFQEREDPANRGQVYHSPDEKSLSSQSSSVGHVRTRRPVFDEFGSLISNVRAKPRRDSEIGKSRFFWSDKKERNLANYRAEIE